MEQCKTYKIQIAIGNNAKQDRRQRFVIFVCVSSSVSNLNNLASGKYLRASSMSNK
jgi:hypothetical protein